VCVCVWGVKFYPKPKPKDETLYHLLHSWIYGEEELSKRKVFGIVFLLWLFLLAPFAYMPRTTATAQSAVSTFLVNPVFEFLSVNDNFTIAVNLTNAQHLIAWQVEIKFNKTGLRLNDVWIPDDNVFTGYEWYGPFMTFPDRDEEDGFSGVLIGGALLGEFDVANVDSGVLCMVNFTVISSGPALIEVTDKLNPDSGNDWYSYWNTPTDLETFPHGEQDALGSSCTVFTVSPLVGDVNGDLRVDITDVAVASRAFGSTPSSLRWNPIGDVNGDGKIDITDIALIAKNFGKHYP